MKKVILLLLLSLVTVELANAQRGITGRRYDDENKVTSKSRSITIIKEQSGQKPWYISFKGGGGISAHADGIGGMYDVEIGFTKYFHSHPEGLFWGVQLGSDLCAIRDRDYHYWSYSYWNGSYLQWLYNSYAVDYYKMAPTLYLGPSIGYSGNLENNICFSLNLSANGLFAFHGYNHIGPKHWGCLIKLQPGVWFNKFYVGLEGFFQTTGDTQGGVAGQIGFRF